MEETTEERLVFTWSDFVAQRPLRVLPPIVVLTAVAFLDPMPWRRYLMLASGACVLALLAYEGGRLRVQTRLRSANLLFPIVLQIAPIVASGGLDSPLLGLTVPLACLAGGQGGTIWLVALQAGLIWSLALLQLSGWPPDLLPAFFGGPAHAHTARLVLTTAAFQSIVGFTAYWIGRLLRGGYDAALAQTVRVRDEILRISAAHAQELQAVSGEVSHELKNPLATIRGLVELMAMDAPTERNAARLEVLHREVVRMQSSIEELLNLSRPLSPLELAAVEVAPLLEEVCSLHEGFSRPLRVSVRVEPAAGGIEVQADQRKLKQILMNLLQNAIEASPPGGRVTVAAHAESGRAAITISDAGPGVDAAIAARAFEPGVTSKPKGAGLGLTIARTLARQHGGDVVLRPREPRGCEAIVYLPMRRDAAEIAA